jgi:hypothetical protein
LRRLVSITTLLLCVALCFSSLAANPPAKTTPPTELHENIIVLKQDSGTDLSEMNITFAVSPTYGSAQTVKFTAPEQGWKLKSVLIIATDGWNGSSKELPKSLPFTIEIRDANLSLLYHFADTQLPYFTSNEGIRIADVEIPELPMSGDFFVCFYGYRSIALASELQNATNNSYLFDKLTGQLFPCSLPTRNNQTVPVNWLIRALGQ